MKLKKFLSLLLALVMTASLLIVPAHAEDAGAEEGGTGTTVNFTNVAPLVKADSTSAANAIRKAPLPERPLKVSGFWRRRAFAVQ